MKMKVKSLKTSAAKVVTSNNHQNIMELPNQEILELFKAYGLIIFQGFGVTHEQMKAFSAQFSDKYIIDPTKNYINSLDGFSVQIADEGTHRVLPHCENGSSPFTSDVIWFCCAVPVEGGETLFWNGVEVWNKLSEQVKEIFLSKKVKYWRDVTVEQWKLFLGQDSTIENVKHLLDNTEGVNYQVNNDESIYLEYVCSAVKKTKFDNQLSFNNSILEYLEKQKVSLDDGSPIPNTVIEEINTVIDKLTEAIPWQTGDMAMIDNSKFLHGRPEFQDKKRLIYTLQTNF